MEASFRVIMTFSREFLVVDRSRCFLTERLYAMATTPGLEGTITCKKLHLH